MLNINLILKIKKKYNFDIGNCKKILESNNWNFEKSIYYIENIIKKNEKNNFNNFSIISVENDDKIIILKIFYKSTIINNSNILNNFKQKISALKLNILILKKEINLLSLKLKEKIFLDKIIIFINKNIYYYNHKNIFFCLLNYKKIITNICCHIIFNKINFLKFNYCRYNLIKQKYIKDDNIYVKNIINFNYLNYSILINKNGFYFYYE
ncbi:hypothetical protein [Candidatus Carsonella ruddii]|uniref:hypothetical protein n=1 Tax=Carsonella ruddii TaxID=114186 RepID=UPI003D9A815C